MLEKCSTDAIYKFTCEFNHEPTYSPVPNCRRREELENRVGLVKFIQKRGKGRGGGPLNKANLISEMGGEICSKMEFNLSPILLPTFYYI